MTIRALTNEAWGFESQCFVCEDSNRAGLRIPFFADDEAATVTAEFTLTEAFSGAPAFVHGGVLMAICDEAMCWATIAFAGAWAMTASNSHRFRHPVRLGRPYRVEARLAGRDERGIHTTAVITSGPAAKVAVEAEAVFAALGPAQASAAIGTEVAPEHRGYLNER